MPVDSRHTFGGRYRCVGCGENISPAQPRQPLGPFLIHVSCTATCTLCGKTVEHVPFKGNDVAAWCGKPAHTTCKEK